MFIVGRHLSMLEGFFWCVYETQLGKHGLWSSKTLTQEVEVLQSRVSCEGFQHTEKPAVKKGYPPNQ